jgi:hypothetical protein
MSDEPIQQNLVTDGFDDPESNGSIPTSAYFEDTGPVSNEEPATLEALSLMARKSGELEAEIMALEVQLAEKTDQLNIIKRKSMPDIMERLGFESFKMEDGRTIEIEKKINASISAENKPLAFAWLREHNCDGIIKMKVGTDFGKGESDLAEKAIKALREAGFDPNVDENVHPATLKAFVREQLEEGTDIPIDVFGIFEFKEAKIKLPRTSKRK